MQIRYNFIFIPILIICAVAVWYLGFREDKQAAAKRLSERALVDPLALEIIELAGGGETIRLEKTGSSAGDTGNSFGEWQITDPINAGCDPAKVSELIQNIMAVESERDIEGISETQIAEYGLSEPEIRLKLFSSSGDIMMDLLVGHENTSNTARYAMFSDKSTDAFLVPVYHIRPLQITVGDLRDIRALVFNKNAISSVHISSVEAEILLEKEEGDWNVTVPERFPASPARVDALLEHILRLETSEFLPENADDPELMLNTVEIGLTAENSEPVELTLHGEDISRGIFATSSWQPSPFLVDAYIYDLLALDPSVFIKTQLIDFPAEQIVKVHVREPGTENLEIERTGSGPEDWRILNPPDRNFTGEGDFQAFIDSLLALQPEYVVSAPGHTGDYGIDPVYYMKIEVYREREMDQAVIKLGAMDGNGNYYATQDGSSYFTIAGELVENFIIAAEKLKATMD